MSMTCPIFNAQEKESYILKINWIVNTFILNESSKHPKLTLKASQLPPSHTRLTDLNI